MSICFKTADAYEKISEYQLTKTDFRCTITIEKGKTSNGYAKTKVLLKNNAIALDGWRYFFMVMINTIKVIMYIIM